MPLYSLPNSTTGVDSILVDTASAVPSFIPMFLLFIYSIILIGGTTSQKQRTGYADFSLWSTLAGVATLIVTLPLTIIQGIVQIEVLAIVVVVTSLSGLWFFMSKGRYE